MYECTFVILGATGDLTKRKLIPAIYTMVATGRLGRFAIIGAANTATTSSAILDEARGFISRIDETVWQRITDATTYVQFDFRDKDGYDRLRDALQIVEQKSGLHGNRLFYLATMPQHFAPITEYLSNCCIVPERDRVDAPWSRIVYEKPFGYSLESAQRINEEISQLFTEDQVYRLVHYLGKELVGNIALLRFTNRVFEPLWGKTDIESIQIIMDESIGIEGRGAFYDETGATRDIVQSHALQLLALVAMEAPAHLSGNYIRDAKAAVLRRVRVAHGVFGQYEGYRSEPYVKPDSDTETFVAATLFVDNERWQGVPFYIRTGKYLREKNVSIHIKFRAVRCLLSRDCPADTNYLTIRISPDEGVYLELNAKVPGEAYTVKPVTMDLRYHNLFGPNTAEAYETLLLDVMRGDQSVFLREDEIELSWQIAESLLALKKEVLLYQQGSEGPQQATMIGEGGKHICWRK